jgi:hypothetical protein
MPHQLAPLSTTPGFVTKKTFPRHEIANLIQVMSPKLFGRGQNGKTIFEGGQIAKFQSEHRSFEGHSSERQALGSQRKTG